MQKQLWRHCRSGMSLSNTLTTLCLMLSVSVAGIAVAGESSSTDTRPGIAPDIRNDTTPMKLQKGDFVAVPIPVSDPTLDTGLVVGAAYFYPQTAEEEKLQPASVTAAAGLYTSNESKAFAVIQQNYWQEDQWRFTGVIGAADLRLSLLTVEEDGNEQSVDWRIKGAFAFAKLARRIRGNWYGGGLTRLVDADQSIETTVSVSNLDTTSDARSVGFGAYAEYDSRDNPLNSYSGLYFNFDALLNDEVIGSNTTYQSLGAAMRSYYSLSDSVVLASELQGCRRYDTVPLWDACTLKLRGFPATDYLGKASASAQLEARWRLTERWGLVGFGGAGYIGSSFNGIREDEAIPSYGVGVRFTVLQAKRINMRLDFARSRDSEAIYFSVGEAF